MANEHEIVRKYFGNPEVLLGFMRRTRKPVWHKSNVYFRDVEDAIRDYFVTVEREPVTIPDAERMAREVIDRYVAQGLLRRVNNQAYTLNMPEFATTNDGTYAMLTIHGAPLPGEAEAALEVASAGLAESTIADEELGVLKGGDVSADGDTLAELVMPREVAGTGAHRDVKSGAPEEPHKDPQAATTNKPNPKGERHF